VKLLSLAIIPQTTTQGGKKCWCYLCLRKPKRIRLRLSKGMEYIASLTYQISFFLDGDYSDYPEELTKIIAPIVNDNIDFVRESR
jgi:hypothetical protein